MLEYAAQLLRSNRHQTCNKLQGTWALQKRGHCCATSSTRPRESFKTSRTIRKIVRDFEGTDDEIFGMLQDRYIGKPVPAAYPDYNGVANPKLDAPVTEKVVTRAAQNLTPSTSPGKEN